MISIVLGPIGRGMRDRLDPERPAYDLDDVDRLLRLRVAAARLGFSVRLVDVDPCLRDLLDLVGIVDWVDGGGVGDGRGGAGSATPRSARGDRSP